MDRINRRNFIKGAAGSAAMLAGSGAWASDSVKPAKGGAAVDRVTLGKTGIQPTRLGIGTGTRGSFKKGSAQTRLGEAEFIRLIRHAYDSGIRLFDLADLYTCHYYMKKALREIPREEIVIQTKIWWRIEGETVTPTLERFKREMQTDYIDICLLHCVTEGTWPVDLERQRDELAAAKEKEIVRAHGVSCHGFAPLQQVAASDWVDSDLARINPTGSHMDDEKNPENVAAELQKIHTAGKGVIGMKIFGEGDYKTHEERENSLRYVLGLDCVDAFVIGFEKPDQIDDTIATIDGILKA